MRAMTGQGEAHMRDNVGSDGNMAAVADIQGIIPLLGELGPGAIVQEKGLCALFGRKTDSVRRAIECGDLPPPVRLFGQNTWTVGVLVRHFEARLVQAATDARKKAEHISRTMIELSS
jgi:hypothetical protein